MENKNLLKVLDNNTNKKFKKSSFFIKQQDIGKTRYFPSYIKEWKNIGYFFNQNRIKKIPFINILVNKLAKIYFNLFFNNLKTNDISLNKRSSFIKNIYISKAEIKYTNSLTMITFYSMNTLSSILKKYDQHLNYIFINNKWIQKSLPISKDNFLTKKVWVRKWPISIINQFLRPNFMNYLGFKLLFSLYKDSNTLKIIDNSKNINNYNINFLNIKAILRYKFTFYNKRLELFYLDILKLRIQDIKDEYSKYLEKIWNLNQLNLNNLIILNNNSFVLKLKKILSKILRIKVDLNIINVKSQYYNPYFITESLSLKLKNTKINVIKEMVRIMNKSNLKEYANNTYKRLTKKNINSIENKYKDLSLITITNNDNLSKILKTIYYTNPFSFTSIQKFYSERINNNYNKLCSIIFNSIKYKDVNGIRLEVKGRLTKRYRADRSIYKLLWKGGLKNKDSSLKGLSTVTYRGNNRSNVMYSISNNKRRIGAFAVKGWVSGK